MRLECEDSLEGGECPELEGEPHVPMKKELPHLAWIFSSTVELSFQPHNGKLLNDPVSCEFLNP